MSDMFDIRNAVDNYEDYRDVLAPKQELNFADIEKANQKAQQEVLDLKDTMEVNRVLKKALLQPIMADVYAKNGIKPQDVAAYIENIMEFHPHEKKKFWQGLYNAYENAAKSMMGEETLTVSGPREWISLRVHLQMDKNIAGFMMDFNEAKKVKKEELHKKSGLLKRGARWIESKAKLLVAGVAVAVLPSSALGNMMKMWDKEDALKAATAQNKTKADIGKVHTIGRQPARDRNVR